MGTENEEYIKTLLNGSSKENLKKIKDFIDAQTLESVVGSIIGDEFTRGENVTIIPPVVIGEDVTLKSGSVVGPYVLIGNGCIVGRCSSVENSILLSNSQVSANCVIKDSIISQNSKIGNICAVENSIIEEGSNIKSGTIIDGGLHCKVKKKIL